MVTLGFFETDREELNKLVQKTTDSLERKDGYLNEIRMWLILALKKVNLVPGK
jgi:hypothetical protein